SLAGTGLNVTPGFVGLPPEPYVNPETRPPEEIDPAGPGPGQLERARAYAITHIIFDDAPNAAAWGCDDVHSFHDSFLSRVMNRFDVSTQGLRPLYIGHLQGTRPRVFSLSNVGTARILEYAANRIVLKTDLATADTVGIADLAYPGWEVSIDGRPAEAITVDNVLRGVVVPAGQHEVVWSFRPLSVQLGWLITLLTGGVLAIISIRRLLQSRRTEVAET
ncbi:MAG: hypothetical protein KDA96_15625, partial [Planctomycetaceae bacterium]|nr:hypothetical protein [Planctomycetaceae bacterium]